MALPLFWFGATIFLGPAVGPHSKTLGACPPGYYFLVGRPLLDARHQGPLLFSNGGLAGLLLGLAI